MPIKLYVVERQPEHPSEAIAHQLGAQSGDWIVDLGTYPFAVYLVTANQTCEDITSTLIEPVDYWQVVAQWLRQFTADSGIHESLSVEGHGFWWSLRSPCFEPSLSVLGHSFAWIDILHIVQQKAKPTTVLVSGPKTPMESVLRQIFPSSTIVYENVGSSSDARIVRAPMSIRIVRLIMSLAYFVFALISRPDICLFSTTSRIQAVVTNGKTVLKDVFLGQVAQALRTRGWRTTFIEVLGPTTWRHLWARGWFFPSDPIHIASHRRLLKRGFYPRLRQRWQSRWLEEKEKIIACLDYRGYDISALVLPLLQEQFALTAPSMELMVNLWRFVFRLWRPKLIYVNHSYGFVAISVVIAAKSLEITSVEQQHGIIGNNHMPYLVPATLDTRVGFPLCDYMITWGEQAKRLFVQRQIYHPDNVFVCGFPRLDKLTREHPHRSTVLQSLNIPLDAKLILYTSNNVHDSYIHLILKGIRNSLDDTNVYWVIKMHPSQQSRRFWEASVDGLGLHRVRVLKGEVDFYALLTACDLHVSFLSTTFIEAALLGKPNLGLDLPHCPDPSGLLEAGAYQPVSLKALGAVVNNILSNESTREILVQKQYAFTQDWCLYDGQSVEHIVTVLESKMREQQYLSGGENERTRQSVFGK